MKYLNKFRKQIIITSTIANVFLILELFGVSKILGYDLNVYKGAFGIVLTTLIQLGIITSNVEDEDVKSKISVYSDTR